jgi:MFS family permease
MSTAKTPSGTNGFSSLFQNRQFLLLWGGQIFSQVADKILLILSVALLTTYQIPKAWTGSASSAVMVANTIPAILFGVAAGIFVDRFPKKKILAISDWIRAIIILSLAVLPNHLAALLAISFLVSTVTQVFAPAEQAVIPLVVKKENLLSANAVFTSTHMSSLIVGYAGGEVVLTKLYELGGETAQACFLAALYILSGICIQITKIDEKIATVDRHLSPNPWQELKSGWNYLKKRPHLSTAIFQIAILSAVIAALPILAIKMTAQIGLEEKQFGLLIAGAGVGLVLGAGTLGALGHRLRHSRLPPTGFAIIAIVLVGFVFVNTLALGIFLAAILGLGAAAVLVPMQTFVQEKTPERMRGKVFGFQNNAVNIALSLPLVIAGPLSDRFGLQLVLFGISGLVMVAAVWASRLRKF